jgi:hypothetical protein
MLRLERTRIFSRHAATCTQQCVIANLWSSGIRIIRSLGLAWHPGSGQRHRPGRSCSLSLASVAHLHTAATTSSPKFLARVCPNRKNQTKQNPVIPVIPARPRDCFHLAAFNSKEQTQLSSVTQGELLRSPKPALWGLTNRISASTALTGIDVGLGLGLNGLELAGLGLKEGSLELSRFRLQPHGLIKNQTQQLRTQVRCCVWLTLFCLQRTFVIVLATFLYLVVLLKMLVSPATRHTL